jgi:hypothetical protein
MSGGEIAQDGRSHSRASRAKHDTMNEAEMRQLYVNLQPGDGVEIVHHIKIGFTEYASNTVGVVVHKDM